MATHKRNRVTRDTEEHRRGRSPPRRSSIVRALLIGSLLIVVCAASVRGTTMTSASASATGEHGAVSQPDANNSDTSSDPAPSLDSSSPSTDSAGDGGSTPTTDAPPAPDSKSGGDSTPPSVAPSHTHETNNESATHRSDRDPSTGEVSTSAFAPDATHTHHIAVPATTVPTAAELTVAAVNHDPFVGVSPASEALGTNPAGPVVAATPASDALGTIPEPLIVSDSPVAAVLEPDVAASTALTATVAETTNSIDQCNGTDNVGGQGLNCEVTVTNNLNLDTGATTSTVTVKECHGAANTAGACTNTTTEDNTLTTSITQCDGSGKGGGGTEACSVIVINNMTGTAEALATNTSPPPTDVTVNQCNDSGTGGGTEPTTNCNPYPASTTGATITQCNGSGNGGGGTMRVTCTVTPGSTESSAIPISFDQGTLSGYGGGG
jgi:hypothetical protein